jgi:hypothetical protein
MLGVISPEHTMKLSARSRTTRWISITAFGACVLLNSHLSQSQDRALVVPDMMVLLQNDRVRVQFHEVAVGEATPMHSHPAYVAYVFNSYTAKAVLPDGTEVPLTRKAGDVFFNEAQTHRIVNTGSTPIHNLIVELKK